MAKNILLKSKDGVEVSFALTQIVLKGETNIKFPSGESWSDGAAKSYVYGESYIAQIPDAMLAQIAALLMPAPVVEEPAEEPTEDGGGQAESGDDVQEGGAE